MHIGLRRDCRLMHAVVKLSSCQAVKLGDVAQVCKPTTDGTSTAFKFNGREAVSSRHAGRLVGLIGRADDITAPWNGVGGSGVRCKRKALS